MHNLQDQAYDLRRLARDCNRLDASASALRPALLLVASGKGGAGTTTAAVNLAVALSRHNQRVLLVDADPNGGDAGRLCGVRDHHTLADVLSKRRAIAEVLQPGPAQISVLPGVWGLEQQGDCSSAAQERLIGEFAQLGDQADAIVVDGGNGLNRMLQRFWLAADLALVVTTAEPSAIMNTYALVKHLAVQRPAVPVYCLVNQVHDRHSARDVHGRIDRACRRFLGICSQEAGHIPADTQVRAAAQLAQPFVVAAPHCPAALAVESVAERLTCWLAERRRGAAGIAIRRERRTP